MGTLVTRLKALAAFDEEAAIAKAPTDCAYPYSHEYVKGREDENLRLRPLVEALIDCVTALEYFAEVENWPYATKGKCPGEKAKAALARLKEIAGEG